MAVSHVAPANTLIQEIASNVGFTGKLDSKNNVIGINVDGINDAQLKALFAFRNKHKLPYELKRVGAGLRLTIGLTRRTTSEVLAEIDATGETDFEALVKKADKNGNPGFNINKLNNYQFTGFEMFYERQRKAMALKRSGTGLRVVIAKSAV